MNPQTPQPDAQVLALTKAIRQKESGGNYGAVGDNSTSTGAYQYQADTWKQYAKEILGNENAEMSEPNQNAVTYGKIKQWKEQGMGPAQIAAAWNAGPQRALDGSWATHKGTTTRNGKELAYDTPSYVKAVVDIYKQQAQNQVPTAQKQTFSSAVQNIQAKQPQVDEPVKKDGVGKTILKSLVKSPLTILARPVQAGFALAGVPAEKIDKVTKDIAGDFIAPTPKGAGDVIKDVGRAAETVATGYTAVKGAEAVGSLFKTGSALKNPEVLKVLRQAVNPGEKLEKLSRDAAITRIKAKLSTLPMTEIGGKLEQTLLKALQELEPQLAQKSAGLLNRAITGNKIGLLDLVGGASLTKPLWGPVKEAITGTGQFKPK